MVFLNQMKESGKRAKQRQHPRPLPLRVKRTMNLQKSSVGTEKGYFGERYEVGQKPDINSPVAAITVGISS